MSGATTRRRVNWGPGIGITVMTLAFLVMVLVPVPDAFIDVAIVLNIGLAAAILLMGAFIHEPLEFSAFPTVLLLMTAFRLGLNVATTRMILTSGSAAGSVLIQAAGTVVIGNDFAVGMVIFLVLVLFNYLVISKGTERVTEVKARFELDGLAPKQLAVDAQLQAGHLSPAEAKEQRARLLGRADFFSAMDGASKYIRGEALAALLITGVNLVGGMVIGWFSGRYESLGEVVKVFSVLTVGDGLVGMIPSFLIGGAAGVIVTRTSSDRGLGEDLSAQMSARPMALTLACGLVSALLLSLAVVSTGSRLPFILGALCAGVFGWLAMGVGPARDGADESAEDGVDGIRAGNLAGMKGVRITFAPALARREEGRDPRFLERFDEVRLDVAGRLGLYLPPIQIAEDGALGEGEYVLEVKGVEAARARVDVESLLAVNPDLDAQALVGQRAELAWAPGRATWISHELSPTAEQNGYRLYTPGQAMAAHLGRVVEAQAGELLGLQEVQDLLDTVARQFPAVHAAVAPPKVTVNVIQKVLRGLLDEGVSIRNLVLIFESLARHAPRNLGLDVLCEHVRSDMARQISLSLADEDRSIRAITFDGELEERLNASLADADEGRRVLALDPETAMVVLEGLRGQVRRAQGRGIRPVLVTSPALRLELRRLTRRPLPELTVIAYTEIRTEYRVRSIGTVGLPEAGGSWELAAS